MYSTSDILQGWLLGTINTAPKPRREREFEEWLNRHLAEAWEHGRVAGMEQEHSRNEQRNPYRMP